MHKNTNALVKAIRLATLAAFAAPASVMAGGFSLNEQSASAMGVANAGAAANPENATTVLFNPAGMSQLSGMNVSFGAAVLDIDAEAKEGLVAVRKDGSTFTEGRGGEIADPAVLPNFYFTHEISDSIDVGFGIHAPYGLAADYENDFTGRYFADETELTVISFSPSLAVNNGNGLSMGAGINIMYAEGKLTKFQDYSDVQAGLRQITGNPDATLEEGYADIEGDDFAVNFRVGFLYELSERTQIGLTAQTATEFNLKGDAKVTNIPDVVPNPNPATSPVVPVIPTGGQSDYSERVRVPLNIPESASLGVRHILTDDVTPQLALDTIQSVTIRGVFKAPEDVKEALADRLS